MTYAGNVDWDQYTWKGIGDINNGYSNNDTINYSTIFGDSAY
jgi:hypothetical protein